MDENLAAQAELALERQGEYDSLCYEGQWHTNGQLAERAARLATGFAELGVRPGDRLLVLMANCPEVPITYTAAWRAGAVVTPLIFLVSEDELRHALVDAGAVGIVTTVEFLRKVAAAVAGASGVRFVVVPGATAETQGEAAPGGPVLDFAQVASAAPGPVAQPSGSDLVTLLSAGGTPGRSRGVPLTHANLYWCGSAAHESWTRAHVMSSILPLPLAHAYGLLVLCGGMHRTDQATTILMRWFDPARWLKLAEQHRVQSSALVPSMIQMLLAQPLEQADLSELFAILSGAAPLAADVRREFEARVPTAIIYEGYGCTEAATFISVNPFGGRRPRSEGATPRAAGVRREFEARVPTAIIYEGYGCTEAATFISVNPFGARRPGSVGLPVPGCEVSIQDDVGQLLPPDQDGEICVRSPGVMAGYWNTPDAAATVLAGGWLHTGDIGHLDADGYLYVVDRKKDLIIRGGFNVYPRDVEDVLVAHTAGAQAGVVGRPDPRLGEEIVAYVSLRPDAEATAAELTEHARLHLAANKYPREIIIVPAVPLTSVGKLDRQKLRQWVAAGGAG